MWDFFRVNFKYSEEVLLSSREGVDELFQPSRGIIMSDIAASPQAPTGQDINLLKVLGPIHVWGLGVGIVLVGEFMGWNYGVGKGGAFGA